MKGPTFEFDTNFEGDLLPVSIGRIYLASGRVARVIFIPDGLKIIIPEASLTNGDVEIVPDDPGNIYKK